MQIAGANESDTPADLASLLRERRSAGEPVRAVSEMPAKGKARFSLLMETARLSADCVEGGQKQRRSVV